MELYAPQEINGAKLLGVFEPGTSAWHEARADGIGGSEIGTIMGLNPWESAFTLFHKKSGNIPQPELDSFAVWRGNAYEEPLLNYFQSRHPELTVYQTGTYGHATIPYLHANPDAIAVHKETGELFVIEVKTSRSSWSEIPPHYMAQVQHYLDVLEIKNAYLIGDVDSAWVELQVTYDSFEADNQRMMAMQFWNGVTEATAPSWDGSQSTYETIRQLHPLIEDREVEIDGGHTLLLAQESYEKALAEFTQVKSEILDLMGTAKHAYVEHDGERFRIASRQARGGGSPYLVIKRSK